MLTTHTILGRRLLATASKSSLKASLLNQYQNDPLKIVVLPINKQRLFVYYTHHDSLQNKMSRLQSTERWFVDKFTGLWKKMVNSPKSYNKKMVVMITQTIDKIPWPESSFLTVPGESYILKRLLPDDTKKETPRNITTAVYKRLEPKPKVHPLSVYYAKTPVWNESTILKELQRFSADGMHLYKKRTIRYLLLFPLTLPIGLLPIVPNIPGFYLMYRAYCSFKAFLGARHLRTLVQEPVAPNDVPSITMQELPQYSELLSKEGCVNSDNMDAVIKLLEAEDIRLSLTKTIRQETNPKQWCDSRSYRASFSTFFHCTNTRTFTTPVHFIINIHFIPAQKFFEK